jgi:hypothetical protein
MVCFFSFTLIFRLSSCFGSALFASLMHEHCCFVSLEQRRGGEFLYGRAPAETSQSVPRRSSDRAFPLSPRIRSCQDLAHSYVRSYQNPSRNETARTYLPFLFSCFFVPWLVEAAGDVAPGRGPFPGRLPYPATRRGACSRQPLPRNNGRASCMS